MSMICVWAGQLTCVLRVGEHRLRTITPVEGEVLTNVLTFGKWRSLTQEEDFRVCET